ncbi:PAS domain S-box protein [Porphyrobacter sp. GA68]|uniref:PAS domain S-box protein n=1 Tax=Porphyrobacter sp. GA68 TaxID=2883480 RepID=UPI001D1972D1|nr:PAS domain S-box protein [Porphyrobacter sp. GA68]
MSSRTAQELGQLTVWASSDWREEDRLVALERYGILGSAREQVFDDIAALAADLFDAPIGVVNFIASDRQWFKAEVGIGADTLPLDVSICRHAILQPEIMVVPDLKDDPRFANNPLVDAEDGLRFYAGAQLKTADGLPLGTVCVLDRAPRPAGITERQKRSMAMLAQQVMGQLELRRTQALAEAQQARAEKHSRRLTLLARASAGLLAASDARSMMRQLLETLADGFALNACFYFAQDRKGGRLAAAAGLSPAEEETAARPDTVQGMCGEVVRTNKAVHRTGIQASTDPRDIFLRQAGFDTYKAVPLMAQDRLIGILGFARRGKPFSPGEREMLHILGGHVATALERNRADADLARAAEWLQLQLDLSEQLRDLTDPKAIKAAATRALALHMGVDRVGYAELEADGLHSFIEEDWTAPDMMPLAGRHLISDYGDFFLPECQAGRAVVIEDVDTDPRCAELAAQGVYAAIGLRSQLVVPLVKGGRLVVLMFLHCSRPRRWSEDDIAQVREVAERSWAAVERARVQLSLTHSEARFRALFEQSPAMIQVFDTLGNTLQVNPAVEKAFGLPSDVLMQYNVLRDPQVREKGYRTALEEVFSGKVRRAPPSRHSGARLAGHGAAPVLETVGFPIKDEAGQVREVVLLSHDVTDRIEAENRLRASEARLRAVLRAVPVGLVFADEFGRITGGNSRVEEILQHPVLPSSRPEEYGEWIAYHPDGRRVEGHEYPLAKIIMEDAERSEMEALYQRGDGQKVWLRFVASAIRDDDGTLLGGVVATLDLDKERRALERLGDTSRRLDAILANTRMAVFMMDEQQHCVYANTAAEELTGYPFGDLVGRRLHDVIHCKKPDGSHYPAAECPIDRAFPERAQVSGEELFVAPDGSFYPVYFTASAVLNDNGEPVGTVIEARNIAEEKAAERHQQLLIDELNHRAKNLLAIVQGIAGQTLKGAEPTLRRALEGRLSALAGTHDLLTRTRWENAPMRRVIDDALAPHASREGVFRIAGPDLPLDPKTAVSLSLAMHELATNAVKYGALSLPDGHVEVVWTTGDGRLRLRWQEHGGPRVDPPAARGFGSRMLERGLAAELGGSVRIDYHATGVVCTVDAPLPEVAR